MVISSRQSGVLAFSDMDEQEQEYTKKQQRRLSDYLQESDDEPFMESNSKKSSPLSPLSSSPAHGSSRNGGLSRFLRFRTIFNKQKAKKDGGEEEEREREEKEKTRVAECFGDFSFSSASKLESNSLNLGMGLGLFLLLAKTNSEYNRMAELHKQMKTLLKEIKDEFESKNKSRVFLNSNGVVFESDTTSLSHAEERFKIGSVDFNCGKMDQMEAELEIELERLQLNFRNENSNAVPEEQRTEFCVGFGENFSEAEQYERNECCGVSPFELEKRLHELLHQRQQERIEELESALKSLEREILEKDFEISRLRTAESS